VFPYSHRALGKASKFKGSAASLPYPGFDRFRDSPQVDVTRAGLAPRVGYTDPRPFQILGGITHGLNECPGPGILRRLEKFEVLFILIHGTPFLLWEMKQRLRVICGNRKRPSALKSERVLIELSKLSIYLNVAENFSIRTWVGWSERLRGEPLIE
jgi:hypothetical protein